MNAMTEPCPYACYILLLTSPSGKRFLQIGASEAPLEAVRRARQSGYQVLTLSLSEARLPRIDALLQRDRAWLVLDNWKYQPEQEIASDARAFQANAQTAFLLQRQGILKPATAQVISCGHSRHNQTHLEDVFVPRRVALRPASWWQHMTPLQKEHCTALAERH